MNVTHRMQIGATLTLPGIAGIVLTMGMAVDANVLIYERIREELRRGNGAARAIEIGYEKAMASITDSNLTTLIAGLILYVVGTGPIKGFAVTLSIGIATHGEDKPYESAESLLRNADRAVYDAKRNGRNRVEG